jgi:membrane-associated protease RseP (regulator of RpoE activity)
MLKRSTVARLVSVTFVMFACGTIAWGQATNDPNQSTPQTSNKENPNAESNAFLGVAVEGIPPSLAEHLHDQVTNGGLLVAEVAADSPAAKAGIKKFDVITTCDDQKLMNPEQLIHLIRNEKPGKTVKLGIIRHGKSETIEATLAEIPASERTAQERSMRGRRPRGGPEFSERFREWEQLPGMAGAHRGGPNWERFESLNLEKTGKDQFKVTISYRNEKGEAERHEFKGTREEIAKDIRNVKDLPRDERHHLLSALDMNSMMLPGVRFVPGQGLVIDLGDVIPDESEQAPNQEPQPRGGKQL